MAAKMLKDEFKAAFDLPFLSVLHDSCTTGSGKKDVTLITSRIDKFYDIAIEEMAPFTMSDVTSSVKKVSNLFEDSTPTDCAVHARENTETVYVVDPETSLQKKERRVCTVGGPFPKGAALIRKYCESYGDSQVFNKFKNVAWRLLIEMEAITSNIRFRVERSTSVPSPKKAKPV
ncbi:hypothetical protein PInf_016380 [Phytophthora infestans]|nr:hypothetical protein PInf_016380 [Phytophthora infestans]